MGRTHPESCRGGGRQRALRLEALNLPVVFGPIAVTYNLPSVSSLNLDGPTLAKIFNGGITTWNDPAIVALNSGTNLPDTPIHVVFRSDESGTTDNFQKYLDAASNGGWGKGAGKVFNGGVGEGAKGNDGTSAAVKSTEGSITYNEWSFAQAQNLSMAKIITSAGPEPVAISTDSVGKTIAGATISGQATTSRSTRCRSTGRRSRAPTRSCWQPMRLSVRSIRTPRWAPPLRPSCRRPSDRAKMGWVTTVTYRFPTRSSRGCRPRSTPSPDQRSTWAMAR